MQTLNQDLNRYLACRLLTPVYAVTGWRLRGWQPNSSPSCYEFGRRRNRIRPPVSAIGSMALVNSVSFLR